MKGTKRIQAIERLRAFAVLDILYYHLHKGFPAIYPLFPGSRHSVDLFFVISGYVVGQSFLSSLPAVSAGAGWWSRLSQFRIEIVRFYLRRMFRVIPLAATWCLMMVAAMKWIPEFNDQYLMGLKEAKAIFQLWYNYFFATHSPLSLGFYWTLMVEEHFYLFLPVFILAFASTRRRLLACVAGAALVFYVLRPLTVMWADPDHLYGYLFAASHCRFDPLFIGVALYLFRAEFVPNLGLRPWLITLLGALFALAIAGLQSIDLSQGALLGHIPWIDIACGGLVFLASFDFDQIMSFPGLKRFMEYVGSRSYSLYLVHVPAIGFFSLHWTKQLLENHWVWTAAYLCSVFLATEVLYRLIERPFIALGRALASKYFNSAVRVVAA